MVATPSVASLQLLEDALRSGADRLEYAVEPLMPGLRAYYRLLVRWLPRVRLVGRADPETVANRHFLDSLTVLPFLDGLPGDAPDLLDVGAGAGFPGIPLALARPELTVRLVDSDRRKVAFMNTVIAELGLGNAQARWARLEGDPEREGIAPATAVISRAFQDLERWLPLGRAYLAPGGRLLAMLGAKRPTDAELAALASNHRLAVERTWAGHLPDGEDRAIVALHGTT